jgi:hypothetical protein
MNHQTGQVPYFQKIKKDSFRGQFNKLKTYFARNQTLKRVVGAQIDLLLRLCTMFSTVSTRLVNRGAWPKCLMVNLTSVYMFDR